MKTLLRILCIAAAAIAGFYAIYLAGGGDEAADANIGAGLIIFAAMAGGSFIWALVDGWRDSAGFGGLALRWVIVTAIVPIIVMGSLLVIGDVAADWPAAEAVGLWFFEFIMGFAPAIAGLGIGYAIRVGTRPGPGPAGSPPPGSVAPGSGAPGPVDPGNPGQLRSS